MWFSFKMNLSKNKIIAVLFCTYIVISALISDYKVMNFYINDEIDYNEWNSSTDSKFETDYISNFWLKYQYVNINGAMKNLLCQHQMNGVVKLKNGYLLSPIGYIDDESIYSAAERTKLFQKKLSERGIEYVWFTIPYVVDKNNMQYPIGVEDDFGNNNLDRLTNAFIDNGISVVDLRDTIHNEGLETYDLFYRTDHHWKTEGGFWAYNQIVEYIEKLFDVEVNDMVSNLDNYEITTYKKWHLGSNGQRTGIYFAGIDDFKLIIPKFDTYIQRYGTDVGGTMSEMMIDVEPLQSLNYMSRYTYDHVLGGSCASWHNPNASVDLKVMVIGDSMAKSVMPFLALSFEDVSYGAYCADTSSVTSELIDEYKPDIVISMNYPSSISEKAFIWQIVNE